MNTDLLVFIGVIVVDVVLFLEIIYFILRRNTTNKLIQAAFEKNEEKFNKISNTFSGKLLSAFDKEYIKYNVAEILKDNNAIDNSIKQFESMNLSKGQKKKIYPKIFYSYIDRNKKKEAKDYYDKLSEFTAYKNKKDIEVVYDTYILGSHKHLDESLKQLGKVSKEELPTLEKKIAKMYENKKINSEAKKYERLAERHLRELQSSKKVDK